MANLLGLINPETKQVCSSSFGFTVFDLECTLSWPEQQGRVLDCLTKHDLK
jgi:hypothetical protein